MQLSPQVYYSHELIYIYIHGVQGLESFGGHSMTTAVASALLEDIYFYAFLFVFKFNKGMNKYGERCNIMCTILLRRVNVSQINMPASLKPITERIISLGFK